MYIASTVITERSFHSSRFWGKFNFVLIILIDYGTKHSLKCNISLCPFSTHQRKDSVGIKYLLTGNKILLFWPRGTRDVLLFEWREKLIYLEVKKILLTGFLYFHFSDFYKREKSSKSVLFSSFYMVPHLMSGKNVYKNNKKILFYRDFIAPVLEVAYNFTIFSTKSCFAVESYSWTAVISGNIG